MIAEAEVARKPNPKLSLLRETTRPAELSDIPQRLLKTALENYR